MNRVIAVLTITLAGFAVVQTCHAQYSGGLVGYLDSSQGVQYAGHQTLGTSPAQVTAAVAWQNPQAPQPIMPVAAFQPCASCTTGTFGAGYAGGGPLLSRPLLGQGGCAVAGGMGCGAGGCGFEGESCDLGCAEPCCPQQCCASPWIFFGEYLLIRPRDAEVAYGVAMNGPVASPPNPPIQVAPVGVVDFDYDSGFRVGFGRSVDNCTTMGVTYSYFDTGANHAISTTQPYVIRSMVSHPSAHSGNSDGLSATAHSGIGFQLVDADLRGIWKCSDLYSINYVAGARYAKLEQNFHSQFAVNGLETVLTDINFDGGGFRLGLEGERYFCRSNLMAYAKGCASFVFGEFDARYAQGTAYDASIVDTGWHAGRVVTILDLELGIGWRSPSGCFRVTAGYMVSSWLNAVKTNDLIDAVQQNNFVSLGDTLTFDGLAIRSELRF